MINDVDPLWSSKLWWWDECTKSILWTGFKRQEMPNHQLLQIFMKRVSAPYHFTFSYAGCPKDRSLTLICTKQIQQILAIFAKNFRHTSSRNKSEVGCFINYKDFYKQLFVHTRSYGFAHLETRHICLYICVYIYISIKTYLGKQI